MQHTVAEFIKKQRTCGYRLPKGRKWKHINAVFTGNTSDINKRRHLFTSAQEVLPHNQDDVEAENNVIKKIGSRLEGEKDTTNENSVAQTQQDLSAVQPPYIDSKRKNILFKNFSRKMHCCNDIDIIMNQVSVKVENNDTYILDANYERFKKWLENGENDLDILIKVLFNRNVFYKRNSRTNPFENNHIHFFSV